MFFHIRILDEHFQPRGSHVSTMRPPLLGLSAWDLSTLLGPSILRFASFGSICPRKCVRSFHQPNKTIYYIAGWASRVTWFVRPPIGRKTLLFYQGTRRWLGLSIHLWVGGLYFYQGIPTRKGSHEIRALMRIFLTRKYPPHQETKVDSTLL